MGELYALDFPNGKRYIGITYLTSAERFNQHVKNQYDKQRADLAIYRAMRKYGHRSVRLSVLASSDDRACLSRAEQLAIAQFNTLSPNGYNLTCGGEGAPGIKLSDAARANMGAAMARRWANPEHRAQLCLSRKGRKQSASTCEKRANAIRSAWNAPGYRERLSAAHKAWWEKRKSDKGDAS